MDLVAVRTFAAVADVGQFQRAADDLEVTQQAVSRRVAALEKELGVRLFTRTPRGADLTADGQAFLPHARALLTAQDRALAAVRPGRRPLRVDVLSRRIAPAALLRDFHRACPEVELEVVTLFDVGSALAAVESGTVDVTVRVVTGRSRRGVPAPGRKAPAPGPLPDGLRAMRVLDEPHQLLTGPGHELAGASGVTPAQLADHRIWIPGIAPGTEWAAYYDEMAAALGVTIDTVGPDFGTESLLDVLAKSASVATLIGERTRMLWPAEYDLRRIPVRDPVPVYPHSLIWRDDNPHPALSPLRKFLRAAYGSRAAADPGSGGIWVPSWVAA